MKICKDRRIWGQNNKEAGNHLGILTGRKNSIRKGGVKGNKNPMYGKHHSVETRKKQSKQKMGDKNPAWKDGITLESRKFRRRIEYRLWREAVKSRDNWTCQECGERVGILYAHHIKSFREYPDLRFAIDNGKTLCLKCHKLTDNFYYRGI